MLVDRILESLKILEDLKEKPLEEILNNRILAGAVLWYLYTVVQGCIDLALKVISELGLKVPESYADSFRVLKEEGIITESLSKKLVGMARFRHVLAHVYTKIDFTRIYNILHQNLEDIREYLKTLTEKLKERGIDIRKL